MDRLTRHGELRAAAHANSIRHLEARQQLAECLPVHLFRRRHWDLGTLGIKMGSDLRWAAKDQDAAQIHVTRGLDVVQLQVAQSRKCVVVRVVIMPGEAGGMSKDCDVGECIISINDVAGQQAFWVSR